MPLEFSIQLNQIFAKIKNLLTKKESQKQYLTVCSKSLIASLVNDWSPLDCQFTLFIRYGSLLCNALNSSK
jgi:hypothetical protein